MLEQCFPPFELGMSWEEFQKLPRHSCYRYSYQNGIAKVTPNLRSYHCRLDLTKLENKAPADEIVPLQEEHWPLLPALLVAGLSHLGMVPPQESSIAEHLQQIQDEESLISETCFAIHQEDSQNLAGAILITRCPVGDLETFDLNKLVPQPHLTWIVIHPSCQRHGLGRQLLTASTHALQALEFQELLSTFLLGNDRATLWHWKMGFELLSHPMSPIQ